MSKTVQKIGIRLEDKSFESRAPLTPSDVKDLLLEYQGQLEIFVQSSRSAEEILKSRDGKEIHLKPRCFTDASYAKAGAKIVDSLDDCSVILGVKEIPYKNVVDEAGSVKIKDGFLSGKTYAFFSHTYKGQWYNREMFLEMIKRKCTLIDYELIVENESEFKFDQVRKQLRCQLAPASKFNRTVYFGKHAGVVGAINSLWVLGLRLQSEGIRTPFLKLKQTVNYREGVFRDSDIADHRSEVGDYDLAKKDILSIERELFQGQYDKAMPPIIIGVTGKSLQRSKLGDVKLGHSASGVKEVIDLLNPVTITPEQLISSTFLPERNRVYVVFFDRSHTTEGAFSLYLSKLTVLLNCMKWEKGDPILVDRKTLKALYGGAAKNNLLRVIGDITCDPGGSIEPCVDVYSDRPYYIYLPHLDNDESLQWSNDNDRMGKLFPTTCHENSVVGAGPVIMSVTNLPCELPKEASRKFSYLLRNYIYDISKVNGKGSFQELYVARPIKRAIILYEGQLTPDYAYLHDKYKLDFINKNHS